MLALVAAEPGDSEGQIQKMAERLTAYQWQFRDEGLVGGTVERHENGEITTRLVEDACIFLNRPGFDGDGLGCAFHHAAAAHGERHLDWMPEVCWQLPLRRIDETDDNGHVTSTVREWKRRDWGEGGLDFHWWCTESSEAFGSSIPVYETMADELRTLVGDEPYEMLVGHLRDRWNCQGTDVHLPHPAVRRRTKGRNG